jgi:hypothetical protein
MPQTIFYSWQSDLPNKINRGFISSCLEKAVKVVSESDLALEFDVDRDTLDVSGSPDIVATIFQKIDNASLFIADITIVTGGEGQRRSPNPNVLVELGYAAAQLTWDNIICVNNLAFGNIEELPFDLRSRRIVTYNLPENSEDKSSAKQELVSKLTNAIKIIHNDIPRLVRQLKNLFKVINPQIDLKIRDGCQKINITVNSDNEAKLLELVNREPLSSLISVAKNGNLYSNNTSGGGLNELNDIGTGQLNGYTIQITKQLAKMLA